MKTWAERVATAESSKCGHYGGCGCAAFQGCCMECPLPASACDRPSGWGHKHNLLRDDEMRELKRGGVPVQDIANKFSMSRRNTFRVLAGG